MLYVHIKQFTNRNSLRNYAGLKNIEFEQSLRDLSLLKDTQFDRNKLSFRYIYRFKVFLAFISIETLYQRKLHCVQFYWSLVNLMLGFWGAGKLSNM